MALPLPDNQGCWARALEHAGAGEVRGGSCQAGDSKRRVRRELARQQDRAGGDQHDEECAAPPGRGATPRKAPASIRMTRRASQGSRAEARGHTKPGREGQA